MAKYTCKCCGMPLSIEDGEQTVVCAYCKTEHTRASLESGLDESLEAEKELQKDLTATDEPDGEESLQKDSSAPQKPKMSAKKKRVIALLLSLALLLGLVFGFRMCSSPPPPLEEIYDRVVELVESANRFNTILYGKGLPTYAIDSEYAEINHLYYSGNGVPRGYLVVSDYTLYSSIDQMKAEAETIYSREWLNTVMYPVLFDGYVSDDGTIAFARYYEANGWIYMSQNAGDDFLGNSGMRLYDYSTMKIIDPSNSEKVIVQMDSWLSSNPAVINPATVTIVLQDGVWLLHSFTG